MYENSDCILMLTLSTKKDMVTWFTSREHLLQLSDSSIQRYMVLFTTILADLYQDTSFPSPKLVLSMMAWGDEILDIYGNNGYKSLRLWEPLMTGLLINHHPDGHVHTWPFLERMKQEFAESQSTEDIPTLESHLTRILQQIDQEARTNPHVLSQLFGLYRIWGHPTVSGIEGIRKLKELVINKHISNYEAIAIVSRKWREYFSISYYSKEGKWPQIDPNSIEEDNHLNRVLKGNYPLDRAHPEYKDTDWDKIKFAKTFIIPERLEITEMISDKATSFDKTKLRERCQQFGDIGPGCDRSVIVSWLRSNFQNPQAFLEEIGTRGFSPESAVGGVYPKERETKSAPRLFGLMTLERRLYIVITEALIADYILPYFPEITMTFDQSTLMTRMHVVTKTLSGDGRLKSQPVVTNIDFEKWNSNMRAEETMRIFQDFDDLFGLSNVFSRSHELFSECTFYLADGSITPQWGPNGEMLESSGVWKNHLGGIEGLRQKGWTIFTVVLLKYICEQNQITCQLMGQGDNQVLITNYYPSATSSVRDQHERFLRHLEIFLKQIGPPIKLEESWSSSHFFTYGKYPILKGIPLMMSLKKMSRCGRLNNEGMINLDSVLSSISANISSAVTQTRNPLVLILPAYCESLAAINLFLHRPFYGESLVNRTAALSVSQPGPGSTRIKTKENISNSLHEIIRKPWLISLILALIPSSLGGYPILQVSDLMMHKFPDPVSIAIWELKSVYRASRESMRRIRESILKILTPSFSAYRNPELICQDPTCLNLIRGSRPKDLRKKMVFDYLHRLPGIKNEAFMTFLDMAEAKQDLLASVLFSMNPFHPRICASIYESTPTGRAQAVIKKVERTRTLESMVAKEDDEKIKMYNQSLIESEQMEVGRRPKSLIERNRIFELNQLNSMLLILNKVHYDRDVITTCSTLTAHKWRTDSWGKDLRGVTVAVPMELIDRTYGIKCDKDAHPTPEYGYIRCQSQIRGDPTIALTSVGPFRPFFGSRTEEKVKYEGGKLIPVSPPILMTALKNLRLINWGTEENSNLAKLLTTIFSTLTDLDWRHLIPIVNTITGTLEHRWADVKTGHGTSPSISYLTSTHFTLNTNKFRPEEKFAQQDVVLALYFTMARTWKDFSPH